MVDTVVLRFHEIGATQPHNRLAEWLNRSHTKSGKTITMTPAPAQPVPVSVQQLHRTTLHYHDTGNVQQVAHFNELKSSHYTIAYKIDVIKNYVEINLSIPKYVFGTNIIHYNRPVSDKKFIHIKHSELEINIKESYKRLFRFLNKFFATEFGIIELSPTLIEINRIDICYNQVFDAKEDAIDYLAQLRKLKKKNARDSTNYSRGRHWKTSITYVTDRYSFKVYHKGAEFAKNDAKKLFAINQAGQHKFIFPIEYYQSFADKILRYEMTFRNSQLNYLYMTNIFRADCDIWQRGKYLYQQFKQAKQAGSEKFMDYRRGLEDQERQAIDYYASLASKVKKYFLAVDARSERFDEHTSIAKYQAHHQGKEERFDYAGLFSPELWDLLSNQFLKILGEFKLNVRQDDAQLLSKAQAHNAKIITDRAKLTALGITSKDSRYKDLGKTITISKLKIVLKMLETSTYEQIAESEVFARETWWRIRKQLASLGLQETSHLSIAMRADMNLAAYNTELLYNSLKFVNLSF